MVETSRSLPIHIINPNFQGDGACTWGLGEVTVRTVFWMILMTLKETPAWSHVPLMTRGHSGWEQQDGDPPRTPKLLALQPCSS